MSVRRDNSAGVVIRAAARPRTWGAAALLAGALGMALPAMAADEQPRTGSTAAGGIESITITARKKEERQIDVPVASTVLPKETIEKYATTELTQLGFQTPGVRIDRAGGGTPGAFIYIRGIGVFGPDYGSEQPVSIVVDGVPIGRGHIVDSGFFDQSSIQVLKGPQSLFFGKNTPAGVIALDSVSPVPGEDVTGYVRASYGISTEDPTLEGAVSIPISDKFAIRVALRGEDMQGGYMKSKGVPTTVTPAEFPDPFFTGPTLLPGANSSKYPRTKQLIGRFTAVYKPNDNFDATLKFFGSYFHNNSSTAGSAIVHCDGGDHPHYADLLTGTLYEDPGYTCGFQHRNATDSLAAPILDNFISAPKDGKYFTLGKNYLTSLKMNLTAGDFTVTSVTGLYLLRSSEFDNYDYTIYAETPDYQKERTRSFTQELHAVSHFDGPVNVTVGAFYENEHRTLYNTNRIFLLGPYPVEGPYYGASNTMIDYDINNSWSFSVFGELTWQITPNLELAGGGRWTKVHKDTHITQPFEWLTITGASPFAPTGADYHVQVDENNFSPQVTLTWHPVRDMTLYGAYRTGFLAGGIGNPGVVTNYTGFTDQQLHDALAFDAEKAQGFEVGVKGIFLNGILNGDLTLFRYRYKGLQVATFHPETTSFSIGNAASAIDQGVEAQLSAQLTDEFNVHASVTYVDLHYKNYPNAPCYSSQTEAQGCLVGPPAHQDLSGEHFGVAPLTVNVGATYDTPISEHYNLSVSADLTAADKGRELNRQPYTAAGSYAILNASIRLYQPDEGWEFAIIGTNLTNEIYATSLQGKPLGAPFDITGTINPSREVRLQVSRRF
ncbi:MAG: TonB-dependent receptor plug domain-containing protein [Alphaproteobacteria bacterium]|nr:TonB-dependent receptor plug domain-containing protein [Alphaproteobacteria bacterium]